MIIKFTWVWNVLRWALFVLGVSKLTFILTGPILSIFVTMPIALFFIVYMKRVERKDDVKKELITIPFTYLLFTFVYDYLVVLGDPLELMRIQLVAALTFFITGLLTSFLVKAKRVTT